MSLQRFRTLEEIAEAMAAWDLELRPQEAGGGAVQGLADAHVALNWVGFEGRVHQLGAPPADRYTIGILTPATYALRWNGRLVGPDDIEIFAPGQEYESCGSGGFGAFTLSIDRHYADTIARSLGLGTLAELTGEAAWAGRPGDPTALSRFKARMRRCLTPSSPATALADLVDELLVMLSQSARQPASRTRRRHVFERALEVIHALPEGETTSVRQICRTVGCSLSTLERAFRDQVGVGPKAYHLSFRLNGARRALLAAGKEDRVADVANRWGFWHMGRFAADYRRVFGELPSETRTAVSAGLPG